MMEMKCGGPRGSSAAAAAATACSAAACSIVAAYSITAASRQLEADKQHECGLVLPSIVHHGAGGRSAERGVAFRSLQSSFC